MNVWRNCHISAIDSFETCSAEPICLAVHGHGAVAGPQIGFPDGLYYASESQPGGSGGGFWAAVTGNKANDSKSTRHALRRPHPGAIATRLTAIVAHLAVIATRLTAIVTQLTVLAAGLTVLARRLTVVATALTALAIHLAVLAAGLTVLAGRLTVVAGKNDRHRKSGNSARNGADSHRNRPVADRNGADSDCKSAVGGFFEPRGASRATLGCRNRAVG